MNMIDAVDKITKYIAEHPEEGDKNVMDVLAKVRQEEELKKVMEALDEKKAKESKQNFDESLFREYIEIIKNKYEHELEKARRWPQNPIRDWQGKAIENNPYNHKPVETWKEIMMGEQKS